LPRRDPDSSLYFARRRRRIHLGSHRRPMKKLVSSCALSSCCSPGQFALRPETGAGRDPCCEERRPAGKRRADHRQGICTFVVGLSNGRDDSVEIGDIAAVKVIKESKALAVGIVGFEWEPFWGCCSAVSLMPWMRVNLTQCIHGFGSRYRSHGSGSRRADRCAPGR